MFVTVTSVSSGDKRDLNTDQIVWTQDEGSNTRIVTTAGVLVVKESREFIRGAAGKTEGKNGKR